jgi:hypothetical protein
MVKNMGTSPVAAGDKLAVAFTVNNARVASLLPTTTKKWKPTAAGSFSLGAVMNKSNSISEWIEANNTFARTIKVYNSKPL